MDSLTRSDPCLRLHDQPRPDHRIRLGAKLGHRVETDLIPAISDAGLHRLKAEASDHGHELDLAMPFSLLGLTLCAGFCPGRAHSFFVGWCSHNDIPLVVVVVRGKLGVGIVVLASPILSNNTTACDVYLLFGCCLFDVCLVASPRGVCVKRLAGIVDGVGAPPKCARLLGRRCASQIVGKCEGYGPSPLRDSNEGISDGNTSVEG